MSFKITHLNQIYGKGITFKVQYYFGICYFRINKSANKNVCVQRNILENINILENNAQLYSYRRTHVDTMQWY